MTSNYYTIKPFQRRRRVRKSGGGQELRERPLLKNLGLFIIHKGAFSSRTV